MQQTTDIEHIEIRTYRPDDANALVHLFHQSVHTLGSKHYSETQLHAWAPHIPDAREWHMRIQQHETFVAVRAAAVVGFIEFARDGHIDMLYRMPGNRGRGAAEALYQGAESRARALAIPKFFVEASLVAEPFFSRHGFMLDTYEFVERQGMLLQRARMTKELQ